MLALLGLTTILALLAATLSKRVSPLIALLIFPVLASLAGGFGLKTSEFVVSGIQNIAPVIGMFVFAILYFGILTDAGTLEPILRWLLRSIGHRPSRIVPGTALLALLVHLDGSGAVVFLVTIPALLPLYERIGIDRRILACVVSMAAGVNFLPWTGPTIRAASALDLSTISIFTPLIGVQIVGLAFVFVVAFLLGLREERRIGREHLAACAAEATAPESDSAIPLPRHFFINILLTILLLGVMAAVRYPPSAIKFAGDITARDHPFPSRTRKLSLVGPMVLHG